MAKWIRLDLKDLKAPNDWLVPLDDIDAVVNAAGALQSGGQDDLTATQRDSILALITACECVGVSTFVQISAPGSTLDAKLEFLRTKGEADDALRRSKLNWIILRPGLVLSPNAFGGTSLLRSLAAFPLIQPVVLGYARLQTVNVCDVANAVETSLTNPALARREFDLVEASAHSLGSLVLAIRDWLGFSQPVRMVCVPLGIGLAIAKIADFAGALGWRSPLRSTALQVLARDVLGDPKLWLQATGQSMKPLSETLAELPSTRQERASARAQLVFPFAVVTLSLFWIASGLIGVAQISEATALISPPLGERLAVLLVVSASALDLLVGLGVLVRRTFLASCFASVIVSLGYLLIGTVVVPSLWTDPLGPYLKVIPGIFLALMLASIAEDR